MNFYLDFLQNALLFTIDEETLITVRNITFCISLFSFVAGRGIEGHLKNKYAQKKALSDSLNYTSDPVEQARIAKEIEEVDLAIKYWEAFYPLAYKASYTSFGITIIAELLKR